MDIYPSIPKEFTTGYYWVFGKLDGQNFRAEYSPKKGWYKFGSKQLLVDKTRKDFKEAIEIFTSEGGLGQRLEEVIKKMKWGRTLVFCEYWGPNSFVGIHQSGDTMHVSLLDINPDNKGILGPDEFMKVVNKFHLTDVGAPFIGHVKVDGDFRTKVYEGKLVGATGEGVVGKNMAGNKLIMFKMKTKSWIDRVKSNYPVEEAEKILSS